MRFNTLFKSYQFAIAIFAFFTHQSLHVEKERHTHVEVQQKKKSLIRFGSSLISSTSAYLNPLSLYVVFFCYMLLKTIDSCFKWNLWTNLSSYLIESASKRNKMDFFFGVVKSAWFNSLIIIIISSNIPSHRGLNSDKVSTLKSGQT